jgi:membrane associated rhomboid family serine protease
MSSFENGRPRALIVPFLIAVNLLVFVMWRRSDQSETSWMVRNFLVSWTALTEGRVWVLLTAVFSHNMLWHLLINMFVLNSFGSLLEQMMGRVRFLLFFLSAGIISSLCHALVSLLILHDADLPALGASGAIAGLVLLFALIFPKEKLLLFGIIPLPALWGALAFVALDIWGLIAQSEGGGLPIGHGAHLGGALTGVIYYYGSRSLRRRRALVRKSMD